MASNEDTTWFDLQRDLTAQEGTDRLEIKGRELPDSSMAGFCSITIRRPVLFSNVTFPACKSQAGEFLFSRVTFKHNVYFQKCAFPCDFVQFDECTFEEGLTFVDCNSMPQIVFLSSSKMRGHVSIRQCRFDRLHILPGNSGRPLLFQKPVHIEDCSFNELCVLQARCPGNWVITGSRFERKLTFSNCRFDGWLHMEDVAVKESPPRKRGQLPDGLEIASCRLAAGLCLKRVSCDGDFTLFNTTVDGPLRLADTSLNAEVTFVSVDRGPRGECYIENVTARKPGALEPVYRYAKVAKQSRGDLDAAGQFYYRERKAHNAGARAKARWLSKPNKPWAWLEHLVGDWLLGYGEKPERPLYWCAGTILVFSLLFYWFDADAGHASSWRDYLLLSVLTFTTLGHGSMQPPLGLPLVLVGVEAILGVLFMPVFVVVLARRFMR